MRPVSPVLTALRDDFAFPCGDCGPVDNWALARFASILAGDDDIMSTSEMETPADIRSNGR